MTRRESDGLEQQLLALRERQAELSSAGRGDGGEARAVASEIVVVARRLGFDGDEAQAIAEQVDAPASGPGHAMAGEYRVLRGSAEPTLTFFALVIGAAVIGLEQRAAGIAVIALALASWCIHGARRVARLSIDSSGAVSFPGHLDRFEPSELVAIDFAFRYPPCSPEHKKAASETVTLRLRLTGGRSVVLARGPLWRISPRRAPVAYSQLERHLSALAREAELKIERSGGGWIARQ